MKKRIAIVLEFDDPEGLPELLENLGNTALKEELKWKERINKE